MKTKSVRQFHHGAVGSVVYLRLSKGPGPVIQAIHPDGQVEISLPEPADAHRLLAFLAEILDLSVSQLEVVAAGTNPDSGQFEKMIAILGLTAATTDARLLAHFHRARKN